jgi:hypothetical protein
VNNKRKKRSKLSDVKQRKWHAKRKLMTGTHAKSEIDEEAEEEEGESHSPMDQVEA